MKNHNQSRRWLYYWLFTGYNFFKNHYKKIALDLSKQQALDTDPKAIQQINFTGNIYRQNAQGKTINDDTMFFIIKYAKETILDFSQGTYLL